MLKGLTDNFSSLFRGESVPKCDLKVAKRHLITLPINKAQQSSCCLGDVITRLSRTQRNQFCGKNKPQPLQPISDSLPARPHSGVSMTKFECLTPSLVMTNYPIRLPALPRISYRRQTFSKLLLLALGVFLLFRLSRVLFRTRTGTGTA